MSRRRKATAEPEVEDGDVEDEAKPLTKKIKGESNDIDGIDVRWEWEDDGHKWTGYIPDFDATITTAYNAGKKDVQLDVSEGLQMKLIFDRLVQKNRKTGWERRMRLAVRKADESDYHIWQWEDEHGNWNPYHAKQAIELETNSQNGTGSVSLVASHRAYTVDLSKMEQVNDSTGVKRTVKRATSDATVPRAVSSGGKKAATKKPAAAAAAAKAEPEPEPSTSKPAVKGSSRKAKSGKVKTEEEMETKSSTKTITVVKGQAPVDPECTSKVGTAHVYAEGKDIYDVMLNQTNLMNNNNKYYLIQLLKDDKRNAYSVWLRWGRVGKKGQTNLVSCGPDLDDAKQVFCRKFSDKTKNDWALRQKFVKVPGKYDMLEMDYNPEEKEESEVDGKAPGSKPTKVPDSKLDKRVQSLVNLICDVRSMEEAVIEMKYDTRKAPLGKLTPAQIKAGYAALKKIDTCVNANDFGAKLVQACDEFYTRVPHDFGMSRPPVIRSKADVKLKLQLLETLGDIEIALKIIKRTDAKLNPVDLHYKDLECDLSPVNPSDETYKLLNKYLQNTHATTHNQYKMEILDLFEIEKSGETDKFKDCGNRMLLWHGSRLTNWVGILNKGLRIAPPEAPVTGYMFGKGVYFADMSSKSANYCFASRSKNVGLVLLCEVALGKPNELLAADYAADKLPKGSHSVMGMGKIAPDPSGHVTMSDGMVVPTGKSKDTGVTNPHGYTLNYNEFIVYDTKQIRMRYLMKVQFNFK